MNGIRKKCTAAVFLLLILFIIFGKSSTDGYNRTFERGELSALRGQMHAEGDMEAGLFSEGPGVRLMPGVFRFSFTYLADSEGSSIAVYRDGSDAEPVYTQSLPASDGTVPAEFVCGFSEDITNLQVRVSYSGQGYFEVVRLRIKSEGWVCNDAAAVALLMAFLAAVFIWLRRKNRNKHGLDNLANVYLLITGAALLISIPLCTDYIRGDSDFAFHLNRIEGIRASLLSGQFPVRVHASTLDGFGYGAPLFYPELLLYIPALMRMAGVSLVTACKLFTVVMNVAAGWCMYLAASRTLKQKEIGILAAVLYLTSVFRLGSGYCFAMYGWFMALSFLPLLYLGVYEILMGEWKHWGYAAAGFTLVLQNHILTSAIATLLIVIACFVYHKTFFTKERLTAAAKAIGLTLLLNLWFIVPFLYMMTEPMNLQALSFLFTDLTVPLAMMFKTFVAIGYQSVQEGWTLNNVMSTALDSALVAANLVLLLPFLWTGMKRSAIYRRQRSAALHMAVWGWSGAFLMSRLMPWKLLAKIPAIGTMLNYIQFPWRMFSFALLFLCMAGAAGIWLMIQEYPQWKRTACSLLVLTAMITSMYYLNGNNGEHVLIMQMEIVNPRSIAGSEYLYDGTDVNRLSDWAGKVTVQKREDGSEKAVHISDYNKRGSNVSFSYQTAETEAAYVEIPLLYYPGYSVWINGQPVVPEKGEQNVIRLWLQPGTEGAVIVRYTGPKLWNGATWVSIAALAVLIAYNGRKYWISTVRNKNVSR